MNGRSRQLAFALCLFILCWRSAPRFKFAHLWAEDGTLFLKEALRDGAFTLAHSYAGYFHTVPRLIALAGLQLPLPSFALFVTGSCIVLHAAVASMAAGPAYEWMARDKALRVGLCFALCLVAGMWEVSGNLCNLHWILFLYLGLLGFQDLEKPLGAPSVIAAWLAAASEGGAAVFLPLFVLRAWWKARRFPEARASRDAAVAAGIAVSTAMVALFAWWPVHASLAGRRDPEYLRRVFLHWPGIVLSRLGVQPLLGDHAAAAVYRAGPWAVLAAGVPLAVVLISGLARTPAPNRALLFLVPVSASAMCLMTCLVRDGALPYFEAYRVDLQRVRYTFVLAPFGLLCWFAALRDPRRRWMQPAYLVLFAALALYRFPLDPMGPERDWRRWGELLEASRRTGKPPEVTVPVNPQGWSFTYRSARAEAAAPSR